MLSYYYILTTVNIGNNYLEWNYNNCRHYIRMQECILAEIYYIWCILCILCYTL